MQDERGDVTGGRYQRLRAGSAMSARDPHAAGSARTASTLPFDRTRNTGTEP